MDKERISDLIDRTESTTSLLINLADEAASPEELLETSRKLSQISQDLSRELEDFIALRMDREPPGSYKGRFVVLFITVQGIPLFMSNVSMKGSTIYPENMRTFTTIDQADRVRELYLESCKGQGTPPIQWKIGRIELKEIRK